jgi:hypothetical protein
VYSKHRQVILSSRDFMLVCMVYCPLTGFILIDSGAGQLRRLPNSK